jgi:hypothetical protein
MFLKKFPLCLNFFWDMVYSFENTKRTFASKSARLPIGFYTNTRPPPGLYSFVFQLHHITRLARVPLTTHFA